VEIIFKMLNLFLMFLTLVTRNLHLLTSPSPPPTSLLVHVQVQVYQSVEWSYPPDAAAAFLTKTRMFSALPSNSVSTLLSSVFGLFSLGLGAVKAPQSSSGQSSSKDPIHIHASCVL